MSTDWVEWHRPYADPTSSLSRRRAVVQQLVRDRFSALPTTRVVSACAGDGLDLLEVLADDPGRAVEALLVETDPRLAAEAARYAAEHELGGVTVRVEDAGTTTAYRDAVPADLVMFCGVFGNVTSDDVRRCVAALPTLCALSATVLWTRGRDEEGGLTAADLVRSAFEAAGFAELAFSAPEGDHFSVGAHRLAVDPVPWRPDQPLFTFVR